MNVVTRNRHNALHKIKSRFGWRNKDGDIVTMEFVIGHQRSGKAVLASRGEPVNKHVITDQQRVLHGAGGNLKVLDDKRDDEKTSYKNRGKSSDRLRKSFLLPDFLLFTLLRLFCFFG